MPNNASACRCVLFEEKNRLVYCGVFLVSSFKVCFSRRPLLYSIRFSSSFLRLVEKHRRNRPPQKSERSKTSSRAMRFEEFVFSSSKRKIKERRRRRLQKVRARTGFGVIVVIATDATSAAFVKTSRRSTSSTTVLRSSFSCCFRVDFKDDAHTKKGCGRLEDEGWWCLLVDEKRLVVFLVGVEMTMLVAANMCRCVCVCGCFGVFF